MAGRGGRGQRGGRGGGRGGGGASNAKICYNFQNTGTCNRKDCKFSHDTGSNETTHGHNTGGPGICYAYKNTGSCDRGDSCRYSHDSSGQQSAQDAAGPTRVKETPAEQQARQTYNAWKRYLGLEPNDSRTMQRLWKGALNILQEGDRDRKQQLPQDLATDDKNHKGYLHIGAILNKRVRSGNYDTFIGSCRNFLLTMTHSSMLDCLSVDTYVGRLFNYMSGTNGARAIPFFQHICETLTAIRTDDKPSVSSEVLESTLVAMSMALSELLRRDARARFNDSLPTLVESLEATAQIFAPDRPSVPSTLVLNHVADVRAMIARANGVLASPDTHGVQPVSQSPSPYPRDLVIPNDRHDNDKLDIADVVIFPTRDEIVSDVNEFLPFTDPDQPHFLTNPVERHIDTHFRLLRHEVFGNLKEALSGLMQAVSRNPAMLGNAKLSLGDVRAYAYVGAVVSNVMFSGRNGQGLVAQLSFQQPSQIQKKKDFEQQQWWEDSRRLQNGCLLSFIWFQDATVQHIFLEVTQQNAEERNARVLIGHDNVAAIAVQLMTQDKKTLQMLMRACAGRSQGIILEFPKLMPATFVPILENLQSMQRLGRIPFSQWIIPDQHTGLLEAKIYHDIPPPLYARDPKFTFSLKDIMTNAGAKLFIEPTAECDDKAMLDELEAKTSLDRGQCRALVAALTREFAFIQGPPGTGKSYLGIHLMRVLLGIKEKAKLGPILVVCYTNHALDQFLEHLLDVGVQKIIRVGGQSKSERLRNRNLNTLKREETRTKSEKYQAYLAYDALQNDEEEATSILNQLGGLSNRAQWTDIKAHLLEDYPKIHSQFCEIDEEGFELVGRHPFDIWKTTYAPPAHTLQPQLTMNGIIRKATDDVYSLTFPERQRLVAHLIEEIHGVKVDELFEIVEGAVVRQENLHNIHSESSRRTLEGADVIGITTSGLAGKISLLKHVRCKVMICEEAGEILEPHMISALLPSVEHCIQIGDHEQLRPSVSNYEDLSLESQRGKLHQLDKSQFERLSVGVLGRPLVPVAQLNVQRRMRPEISTLIRETIYDKLIDHATTAHMPDVVGLRKNVFWLNHDYPEDGMDADAMHDKSKTNPWEIAMVKALVHHVVRQGIYKSSDIAVLTPYTGQLQKLRQAMRNDYEIVISDRDEKALADDGFDIDECQPDDNTDDFQNQKRRPLQKKTLVELLRVATVDNFQGEEAKVVIVSLVRSNKKGKVGFLKSSNRINVLLSRAKHGMYIIGNTETYARINMWQKVIDMLRAKDFVGDSLELMCPRHPDTVMEVRQPEDFEILSFEGGCMEACVARLDCGHSCKARCHSEIMHAAFRCREPCQRRHHPCNHACQKPTCGEDCGKCMINLDNVQLPCGHTKNCVHCYLTLDTTKITCNVQVTKQVPGCLHDVTVQCSRGVAKEDGFKCPTSCGTLLPCGHSCPGTCGRCNTTDAKGSPVVKHADCSKICGRKFGTCNHNCPRRCHDGTDCGLCHNPCEIRCKHNKCPLKCHEPCAPCIQPCVWECEHQGKCTMPCSAPCNRMPCDERCTKLLLCGHQCPSICGEECPVNHCQKCGMNADGEPDMILFEPYKEIDLDKSPIIVLGCPHFFTIETLDGQIKLKEVYTYAEETQQYTGLIDNGLLAAKVPECPHCRRPIRQHVTQRYNRLVNRAVMDEMTKRFIVNGKHEVQMLETKLTKLEQAFEKSRQSILPKVTIPPGDNPMVKRHSDRVQWAINNNIKNRYSSASGLLKDIKACQKRMADQPASKLHEATVYAISKNSSIDDAMAKLSIESSAASVNRSRDHRITFSIRLLELKVRCTVLEDKYDIACAIRSKYPNNTPVCKFPSDHPINVSGPFLKDCRKLIEDCFHESLPKLAVEATLYYSRIARLVNSSGLCPERDRKVAEQYRTTATQLLEQAAKLCGQPFQGAKELAQAIERSTRLLYKEFYEEVSKEEIEAIKRAMVSGPGGIATHSGHWYDCENGHPFAIGECGMPMERARCPECGAPVGGQNHTAVAGVSRASRMEH